MSRSCRKVRAIEVVLIAVFNVDNLYLVFSADCWIHDTWGTAENSPYGRAMITNPGCELRAIVPIPSRLNCAGCSQRIALRWNLLECKKLHQKYSPCANAKARATDASRAQTPAGAFGLADLRAAV